MVTAASELRHEDGGGSLKYPDECPVFEVTNKHFYTGLIVEGIGWDDVDLLFRFTDDTRSFMGGKDWDGFMWESDVNLKPLTPAAEEMLAIARERSGS